MEDGFEDTDPFKLLEEEDISRFCKFLRYNDIDLKRIIANYFFGNIKKAMPDLVANMFRASYETLEKYNNEQIWFIMATIRANEIKQAEIISHDVLEQQFREMYETSPESWVHSNTGFGFSVNQEYCMVLDVIGNSSSIGRVPDSSIYINGKELQKTNFSAFQTVREPLYSGKRKLSSIYDLTAEGFFKVGDEEITSRRKRCKIDEAEKHKEFLNQITKNEEEIQKDQAVLSIIENNYYTQNIVPIPTPDDSRIAKMNRLLEEMNGITMDLTASFEEKKKQNTELNEKMMENFEKMGKLDYMTFVCDQCEEPYCHNVSRCTVPCECPVDRNVCCECLYKYDECKHCNKVFGKIEMIRKLYL